MKNFKMAFVIPYFGQWPFWMSFFLESCKYNSSFDWIFFTDCGIPENSPENVFFEEMSFEDYCSLVSSRLGLIFFPESPYKLCDIKPALPYIHQDRISEYDFVGFSDIDLVYGDLRKYFDDTRLSCFDLFSTHSRRISGHLCLMRNTKRMRQAFMNVPGWRDSFESKLHNGFDEGDFSRLFIRHKNWPELFRVIADRFNSWRQSSVFEEAYSTPNGRVPWHDGTFNFPEKWIWRRGILTNDINGEREFPYFHFIGWKCDFWSSLSLDQLLPDYDLSRSDGWCVTAKGFREV